MNIENILELIDFIGEDPLFSYEDKSLLRWYFTLTSAGIAVLLVLAVRLAIGSR